jgi:hypothetical protein
MPQPKKLPRSQRADSIALGKRYAELCGDVEVRHIKGMNSLHGEFIDIICPECMQGESCEHLVPEPNSLDA